MQMKFCLCCFTPGFTLSPQFQGPGRKVQSVMCLTTDQGVASSIPARSHTSVEIDHEISSTAILIHEGLLQAKVCAQIPD